MVDYKYKDLFLKNSIPKQVIISFDNVTLTNEDLYNQEMSLEESLCSEEEIRFGCCEASVLKFKISDVFSPMKGKWLDVKMIIDGHYDAPFPIGRYRVDSDEITADRKYREIIAYDFMYNIIDSSVIKWYNTILPDENSKVTMKQFRTSFMDYFGLEQQEITLVNDNMVVEKTIQVGEGIETDNGAEQVSILRDSALSGLDVISAICEINGCFGHIGRDGKFCYIYLQPNIQGLYPSDDLFPDHAPNHLPQAKTGHLYPQDPKSYRIGKDKYIECKPKKFITKVIDVLQIRQNENEIGQSWPEKEILQPEENCYVIQDNFLVYGKSAEQLRIIAKNIYDKIHEVVYQPFEADVIGNPCLEVGDSVRFPTKFEIVESYVLQRTLTGTQALRDSLKSDGVEKYSKKMNGVQSSIIQLKGKTNELKRNVEETRLEMRDTDKKLATDIGIMAGKIVLKVDSDGNIAQVSLEADPDTGTVFKVNAENIELTAEEAINFLSGGTLNLTGKKIKIESENFSVDEEGNLTAVNAMIKGDLSGSTINNGNGNFSVDEEGNVKMLSAEITGKITGSEIIGSEITGSKIVGGEVTGATIKALEGLYLQYYTNEIPPRPKEYVLANISYDGSAMSGGAVSCFNNPQGGCVMKGIIHGETGENGSLTLADAAYFPDLAIINRARIDSMQMTYYMENSFLAESGDELTKDVHEAYLYARVFGVFACVYGRYNFLEHKSKKTIDITIDDYEDKFLPKWASVETSVSYKGNVFLFVLRTNGVLRITNTGSSDVTATGDGQITINFRLDFIRM